MTYRSITTAILLVLAAYVLVKQEFAERAAAKEAPQQGAAVVEKIPLTFLLGQYRLRIPQSYVTHTELTRGILSKVHLQARYPDIQPAEKHRAQNRDSDVLRITLSHQYACASELSCHHYGLEEYRANVLGKKNEFSDQVPDDIDTKEEMGFLSFPIHYQNHPYRMFVKGTPQSPEAWYHCKLEISAPYCETVFAVDDELWATVLFSIKHLEEADGISESIRSEMRRFIDSKRKTIQ